MIPKEDLELFLTGLNKLKKNGPEYADVGICGNFPEPDEDFEDYGPYDLIEHYSPEWEHFSGDPTYPIPYVSNSPFLWKGKKGKLRYDLIDFVIKTVTKELEVRNGCSDDCL